MGTKACIGMQPLPVDLPEWAAGRGVAGKVNTLAPRGIVVVSAYLKAGVGPTGVNLDLLEYLASFLRGLCCPWVCGAGWNFTPEQLEDLGWP